MNAISRATSLQEGAPCFTMDPVMARLIDVRPDFDPHAWITQLPPTDQRICTTRSCFRSSGSNFQSRPLGGHSSLSRLFLAVIMSPAELLADPRGLRQAGLS